jgi:hypothetical protein
MPKIPPEAIPDWLNAGAPVIILGVCAAFLLFVLAAAVFEVFLAGGAFSQDEHGDPIGPVTLQIKHIHVYTGAYAFDWVNPLYLPKAQWRYEPRYTYYTVGNIDTAREIKLQGQESMRQRFSETDNFEQFEVVDAHDDFGHRVYL